MTFKDKKLIFFLGLGILLLGIEESLYHNIITLSIWVLPVILLTGIGSLGKRFKKQKSKKYFVTSPLTLKDLNRVIADTKETISCIMEEDPDQNISDLKMQLQNLEQKKFSSSFSVGIVGKKNTGKTTIF